MGHQLSGFPAILEWPCLFAFAFFTFLSYSIFAFHVVPMSFTAELPAGLLHAAKERSYDTILPEDKPVMSGRG